jgi:hypothetical protein
MKRVNFNRRTIVVVGVLLAATVAAVIVYPIRESTYEFDAVNLRSRACLRYRSALLGFVLRERCGGVTEHPTATRLRELGVLSPVNESAAHWVLIKGFKPGVSGWSGTGKEYLGYLGATTFGTPVPFAAKEDLERNVWVKWAVRDPGASKRFWSNFQATDARMYRGSTYLYLAWTYLREHDASVDAAALEAYAAQARAN